jgi:hypothetical protein
MNVWTHLFGAVLFCSFGCYLHTAPDMLIMEPIFLEPGLQLGRLLHTARARGPVGVEMARRPVYWYISLLQTDLDPL